MPLKFPSPEWVAALVNQINSDDAYAQAARTWEGDLNFVIERVPGVDTLHVIYVDLWHGKCRAAYLTDAASAPAAKFKINAPLANWKRVITRQIGPIPALVSGQLKLHGNMAYILRHVNAAQQLVECATRVETEFPM
ncbi:MAG TPA: SCP2 sterol-binding domain-containing protein [Anaerolineae bacterium]|nr:SCP2 sterol-binding domain-containing protein [Anaerolineae bacterium]